MTREQADSRLEIINLIKNMSSVKISEFHLGLIKDWYSETEKYYYSIIERVSETGGLKASLDDYKYCLYFEDVLLEKLDATNIDEFVKMTW